MKKKNIIAIALVFVIGIAAVVTVFRFGDKIFTPEKPTNTTQDTSTTERSTEQTTEKSTEKQTEFTQKQTEYMPKNPLVATGKALTEKEIKEFLPIANELYMDWVNPGGALEVDWDNEVIIDGERCIPVISGGLLSVDAIASEVQKFFSEEIYTDLLNDMYLMHDGKIYICGPYGEGGDIGWKKFKLEIKASTPTECNFIVTTYFEDTEKELEYKMKVIDGKWKFVESFEWIVTLTADSGTEIEWVE